MKIKFYILFILILLLPGFLTQSAAQTMLRSVSRHFLNVVNHNSTVSDTSNTAGIYSAAKNSEKTAPNGFSLSQNNPNPFNLSTIIRYSLGKPSRVKLTVYNAIGREIKVLDDTYQNEGSYQVVWNGTDNSNYEVSSGVYFYRLETSYFVSIKKMILMK